MWYIRSLDRPTRCINNGLKGCPAKRGSPLFFLAPLETRADHFTLHHGRPETAGVPRPAKLACNAARSGTRADQRGDGATKRSHKPSPICPEGW